MTNRRKFVQSLGLMSSAFSVSSLFQQNHAADFKRILETKQHLSPAALAEDEDFWAFVQQGYTTSPNIINLNNGGVSPSPRIVQEAVERYNKLSNEGPSYFMWRVLDQGREPLRDKLAELAGVESVTVNQEEDSVTITHNEKSTRQDFTKKLHDLGYPEATEENGLLLQLKSYASCIVGRMSK